ncbi:MAG: dCMP deaminase family protein [Puniceicoccales bacterium]|jgi:dCMP deaminase|nr:dCMP deaminase family protein [Puniceicoccales bacterium]
MGSEKPLYEILGEVLAHIPRPNWDEYFLSAAMLIATRSPCARQRVGCVIVTAGDHGNRIVASGYNGFLPGLPHRSRVRDGHELGTVHAEQNAISDAAKRGASVAGSTAYVTHYPCIHCAKVLIAAGIGRIYYHCDYNNDPLVGELLGEAHVEIKQL